MQCDQSLCPHAVWSVFIVHMQCEQSLLSTCSLISFRCPHAVRSVFIVHMQCDQSLCPHAVWSVFMSTCSVISLHCSHAVWSVFVVHMQCDQSLLSTCSLISLRCPHAVWSIFIVHMQSDQSSLSACSVIIVHMQSDQSSLSACSLISLHCPHTVWSVFIVHMQSDQSSLSTCSLISLHCAHAVWSVIIVHKQSDHLLCPHAGWLVFFVRIPSDQSSLSAYSLISLCCRMKKPGLSKLYSEYSDQTENAQANLNFSWSHKSECIITDIVANLTLWMNFSIPELRDQIVLSPQFLVNSLKSVITADEFCKKKPEVLDKWREFRQKGVLRQSLLGMLTLRMLDKIYFARKIGSDISCKLSPGEKKKNMIWYFMQVVSSEDFLQLNTFMHTWLIIISV